ncbi:MAG: hypothetical protein V2A55_02325 [Candidatus Jorgensenbacteria bacterium]
MTKYPEVVVEAMGNLYSEYNRVFAPLVAANREWDTDYQYCLGDSPINWCVQVDMVGLPETFLEEVGDMPEETVREILRKGVFEIENSIAMYQLLENLFPQDGRDSFFKTRFLVLLDDIRRQFGKPIALLAVTEPKYRIMLESEFGRHGSARLTDAEVRELSGFDHFFDPHEFSCYLTSNGGKCEYLLYVRASDPVIKLQYPSFLVTHPLLSDSEMRRLIKENALTFSIDNPDWPVGDSRRINDTKEYMSPMGMAFPIKDMAELRSPEFEAFLREQGYTKPKAAMLRCKPAKGTYGCYGHAAGIMRDGSKALARGISQRGSYVVQPEITTPVVTNTDDGKVYTFIDRVFFGMVDGCPKFLGGVRNLMPTDTEEVRKGRIHGNSSAVYAEIVC